MLVLKLITPSPYFLFLFLSSIHHPLNPSFTLAHYWRILPFTLTLSPLPRMHIGPTELGFGVEVEANGRQRK